MAPASRKALAGFFSGQHLFEQALGGAEEGLHVV
jgi:hypothetical protein